MPVTDLLPPFSTIKRKTPVKRVSKKRGVPKRVGKLGTVRLRGMALRKLRWECYVRDQGHCRECNKAALWEYGEMAHVRTKRNNGDTLSNVRWLCNRCHGIEHSYGKSGIKPVPAKAKGDA
jgi:5-methylcytosine-specific restriction endonuclease McrA